MGDEPDDLLAVMGAAVLEADQWKREAARDIVLRALRAAVEQDKVSAAYEVEAISDDVSDAAIRRFDQLRDALAAARRETQAAGAALAKALRGVK